MKNVGIIVGVIVVAILGFVYLNSLQKQPNSTPQSQTNQQPTLSGSESTPSSQTILGYQGKVLAGKSALFLEFNKGDYEKALSENKVIVLNNNEMR